MRTTASLRTKPDTRLNGPAELESAIAAITRSGSGGRVNILVVESEETTGNLMSVMLTKLGYKVALASGCSEAAGMLSGDKAYDVVVIALKFMRGSRAGGTKLIDALLAKNPNQHYAFLTSSPVLKKPFTLQDVDDFMGAFRRPGQSRFS